MGGDVRHHVRAVGLHEDAARNRAMAAFGEILGRQYVRQRQRAIDALPTVKWKGRTLYTIRCAADFGNGPHNVNVPESVLWSLIDLRAFRCAYHR